MTISKLILTPAEKYGAWRILVDNPDVFKMGQYFYVGMTTPRRMPKSWEEVDCHLLGFLTERCNQVLDIQSKEMLENFILGARYKKFRHSIRTL